MYFSALNTQRSCLIQNGYIEQECGDRKKVELYKNVSAIFLATWCKLPPHPSLGLPPEFFTSASNRKIIYYDLRIYLLFIFVIYRLRNIEYI